MAKHFKADALSISSIENLKRELQRYRDGLEDKARLIAQRLAEKGVEIARLQITSLDAIFTGDLMRSIHSENLGKQGDSWVFCVATDDESALYVEFGTGMVGKQSPYTGTLPEGITWEYGSGGHYVTLKDGRYGWFYPGEDGKYYFTEGMPSRQFLTNTAFELENLVLETVREVFANG